MEKISHDESPESAETLWMRNVFYAAIDSLIQGMN